MCPKRFSNKKTLLVFSARPSCAAFTPFEGNKLIKKNSKDWINSSPRARASKSQLKSFFGFCVTNVCSFFLIFHQHSWGLSLLQPVKSQGHATPFRISYLLPSPKHYPSTFPFPSSLYRCAARASQPGGCGTTGEGKTPFMALNCTRRGSDLL